MAESEDGYAEELPFMGDGFRMVLKGQYLT